MLLSLLPNNQTGVSLLFSFLTFKRWHPASNAPWLVNHTGVLCARTATKMHEGDHNLITRHKALLPTFEDENDEGSESNIDVGV